MSDCKYQNVSSTVIGSLKRYADLHIETGGFLRAVLENDLKEACARSDLNNARTLWDIVNYIYNELPSACWGSPEKVDRWLSVPREVALLDAEPLPTIEELKSKNEEIKKELEKLK